MILALDAGNTRIKWGVFDTNGMLLAHGSVEHALLGQLDAVINAWPDCRRVVVSNVAGNAVSTQLIAMAQAVGLSVSVIEAAASACGVQNRYEVPAAGVGSLGCAGRGSASRTIRLRRRHGRHGAHRRRLVFAGRVPRWRSSCRGGRLCGLPGVAGTAGLSSQAGDWAAFPQNTADAMYTGCLSAMAGAVDRVYSTLQERRVHRPAACWPAGMRPCCGRCYPCR